MTWFVSRGIHIAHPRRRFLLINAFIGDWEQVPLSHNLSIASFIQPTSRELSLFRSILPFVGRLLALAFSIEHFEFKFLGYVQLLNYYQIRKEPCKKPEILGTVIP